MAKKKKTQLRPVARGFATTSVPKKVPLTELVPAVDNQNDMVEDQPKVDQGGIESSAGPAHSEGSGTGDQPLQSLVDKLQEKTEKEITRTIKALESDRRFSRSLPSIALDPSLTDRIISLALEVDILDGKKVFQESQDKAIARLGITYGVLRRLGFSEARVEECLRAMPGVDLDEAYEWLCLHCKEEELEDKRTTEGSEPKPPRTPANRPASRTITSRSSAELLAAKKPKVTSKSSFRLDANAPSFIPASLVPSEYSATEDQSDLDVISSNDDFDSGPEPLDTDDLAHQYARLRLQYDKVTSYRKIGYTINNDEVHDIKMRLHALKNNYFFDEHESEAMYQLQRDKEHERALQDQLRGVFPSAATPIEEPTPRPKLSSEPQPQTLTASEVITPDIFDDDSGDSNAGGVLDLLEVMPTTEIDAQGKTIIIRDLAMPKHFSGRTPKMLLTETVAKSDRYAAIGYTSISSGSRARRASVSIRWEGKKMDEWFMEDVACHDDGQAEQYIATVALHALTFPLTDGFAASISAFPGSQTFFRLLPAVFRDLWNELEEKRKARDDKINRDIWAKLLSILEFKMETSDKPNEKTIQPILHAKNSFAPPTLGHSPEVLPEQLASSFRARQASASYQEMLTQRNLLPIARYREEVVEQLQGSQVLVLSGETGCGKSTQVPAFILEDQLSRGRPCKIYCTEPRRISAISLAQRVSRELGDAPNTVGTASSLVGYSIRLESNISRNTRLAFVTNGIALRMLEGGTGQGGQGTAFDEITHIIIDEVHERTIESDFLLIVLKSLLEARSDLKVILMSATVDADKISSFFGGCPVIHVPGRTFPVDVKFLEDAVEYTKWSISESSPYARRVHDKFYRSKNRSDWTEEVPAGEEDDDNTVHENVKLEKRYSPETAATINLLDERLVPYDLIIRLLERICFEDPSCVSYSCAILIFLPGLAEIRRLSDVLNEHPAFGSNDFKIYPLHSMLSSENQNAVFDIPPPGIRKVVIATNIAETGITIPDITCVIDSGKHREMRFDEKRQISRLVETFVAKSNAAQRRGRAGRVQRGLCFHLFTKIRHDTQMADHPLPEMMRLSLSDLALRIKIMKVKLGSSIEDVLSRALDPPVAINVQRAISMLVEVRALTPSEEITPMGRLLSKLPTDVHLGKFLLTATLFRCLDPALTIAAALNSKSPFVTPFGFEQEADRAKHSFRVDNSDFLTIHNAFGSWRRASANPGTIRKFCRTNYLSHQNLQQIEELRQQFLGYLIDSAFIQVDKLFIRELSRARYGRHRTRFVTIPPELDVNSGNSTLINAALTAGLFPKVLAVDQIGGQMRTISNNQYAFFHPSSVNFGRKPTDFGVNHLAYFTLMHSKKLYAWETGPVDDLSVILLCGECDFKLISNSASIDRKIKFHLPPKSNIALKVLRTQLGSLLAHQFRGKALNESQTIWNEVSLLALGKVKIEDENRERSVVMIN